MQKVIKNGNDMEYGSLQYEKMIKVKNDNNLQHPFMEESIIDYNADSNLGGALITIAVSGYTSSHRLFRDDSRIKNIEFEISLKPGFLSWLEIWKTIDDFIIEYETTCECIHLIEIYEYETFFGGKQICILPFFGQ